MDPVVARPPDEFSSTEIEDFMALVLAGGEVAPQGLKKHVLDARCIAFLRSGECLVGVAGLKRPRATYRQRVQKSSNFALSETEFPFELGWVFILPSARGANLSLPLCQSLISEVSKSKIFATSAEGNLSMHATLKKLGFARVGSAWASKQNEGRLLLFVRNAG